MKKSLIILLAVIISTSLSLYAVNGAFADAADDDPVIPDSWILDETVTLDDYLAYMDKYAQDYDVNGDGMFTFLDVTDAAQGLNGTTFEKFDEIFRVYLASPCNRKIDLDRDFTTTSREGVYAGRLEKIYADNGVEYPGPTRYEIVMFGARILDSDPVKTGDIDKDGSLTARDVIALMKLALSDTSEATPVNDVNGDGALNARDIVALMKQILG